MRTQDIFIAHPNTLEQVNALQAFMQALKIILRFLRQKTIIPIL